MQKSDYVIISPCRNEEQYMRRTLDTVLNQSIQPSLWVIVDDGSTDDSSKILASYAQKHDFLKIVTRANRGHRSVGPGVVDTFYKGLEAINVSEFTFLCKLDLDLELPTNYFEIILKRMNNNHRIGTCSGKPYYVKKKGEELVSEKCGDENSVGMIKFYRRDCFQQIGGFVREVMWDGIDGHRCRMLGWIACSWSDPDLRFIHLRPMGSSQKNWLTGRARHGFGQYFMGTGLGYMIISSFYRMMHPPYFLGGLAMLFGYCKSRLIGAKRYDDMEFRSFLHDYQKSCIRRGKSETIKILNKQQESKWVAPPSDKLQEETDM